MFCKCLICAKNFSRSWIYCNEKYKTKILPYGNYILLGFRLPISKWMKYIVYQMITSVMENSKTGEKDKECEFISISLRVTKKDLTQNVIFVWRPQVKEWASWLSCGRAFNWGRENNEWKYSKRGQIYLACWRKGKETIFMGQSEKKNRVIEEVLKKLTKDQNI